MKIILQKIGLTAICISIFILNSKCGLAFSSTQAGATFSYYSLSLIYDSDANTVSLNNSGATGNLAVDLSNINLIDDTGNGSQFYTKILDQKNQPISFKSGSDKFFLGQWKMVKFTEGYRDPVSGKRVGGGAENIKKGGVQTTVPYSPEGQKIEIYDAKTNKLSLSVDVSKFSKVSTATNQVKNNSNATSSNQLTANQSTAENVSGNTSAQTGTKQSFPWLWTAAGLFILLLAGTVFFLYKRYKKYKSQIFS